MESLLSISWELLINLIEVGIFYFYINNLLTPKNYNHGKLIQIALLSIRFFGITIGNAMGLVPIYTISFSCIFNIIFSIKLFKEKKIICFFWGGLNMLLGVVAELISYFLLTLFTPMLPHEIMFGEAYRFSCTTLYIICLAALCFFVSSANKKTPLFTFRQKVFIFVTMILGTLLTHCFMYIMVSLEATENALLNVTILANVVFLCFFIFLLFYIYQLALTQQENEALQEKARLLELEEHQYNNLLSTTASLREIKHDIHHHLSSIQTLIRSNDTQKLSQYLKEYETHFDLDYTVTATGNIIIDSILANKLYYARQQHTRLDYSVLLPDAFPFTDVALTALLGNLFDNALEACKKVTPESERRIDFKMKTHENMLLIHMENTFDGIVKTSVVREFLSRKEEPDHGVGLKRVGTLVEEAGGFMEIRYDEQIFTVHIMVPLEDKNDT